jgi:hypothetical protein
LPFESEVCSTSGYLGAIGAIANARGTKTIQQYPGVYIVLSFGFNRAFYIRQAHSLC